MSQSSSPLCASGHADRGTGVSNSGGLVLTHTLQDQTTFQPLVRDSPKKPCLEWPQARLFCVPSSLGSGLVHHLPMHIPVNAAAWAVLPPTLSLMWTDGCCGLALPSLPQAWSSHTVGLVAWLQSLNNPPQVCPQSWFLHVLNRPDPSLVLISGHCSLAQLVHTHSGSVLAHCYG